MLFLVLPASAVAIREDQLARRRFEIESAEALVKKSTALERIRSAQVLLSTQVGDREFLDQGFALGKQVLADYGIEHDGGWTQQASFRLLPPADQNELRGELGEMLLLFCAGRHCAGCAKTARPFGGAKVESVGRIVPPRRSSAAPASRTTHEFTFGDFARFEGVAAKSANRPG